MERAEVEAFLRGNGARIVDVGRMALPEKRGKASDIA